MNNLALLDQNAANDVSDDSSEEEEDDGNFFEAMVDAIDIRGDEDIPGGALVQAWAEKINLAWTTGLFATKFPKWVVFRFLNDLESISLHKVVL